MSIYFGIDYRSRDNKKVRIYAIDGPKGAEIHGAIKEDFGWKLMYWDEAGRDNTYWGYQDIIDEWEPVVLRKKK